MMKPQIAQAIKLIAALLAGALVGGGGITALSPAEVLPVKVECPVAPPMASQPPPVEVAPPAPIDPHPVI